jgi:hypothetical protein
VEEKVMQAQAEFQVSKWDESHLKGYPDETPLSSASIIYETTHGEIEGKFHIEYVMHYTCFDAAEPHKSAATFAGFMLFEGSIGSRTGSFVMEDKGTYANFAPASHLSIKPGTGTGDFVGITGSGKYGAVGEKMIIELDFSC